MNAWRRRNESGSVSEDASVSPAGRRTGKGECFCSAAVVVCTLLVVVCELALAAWLGGLWSL